MMLSDIFKVLYLRYIYSFWFSFIHIIMTSCLLYYRLVNYLDSRDCWPKNMSHYSQRIPHLPNFFHLYLNFSFPHCIWSFSGVFPFCILCQALPCYIVDFIYDGESNPSPFSSLEFSFIYPCTVLSHRSEFEITLSFNIELLYHTFTIHYPIFIYKINVLVPYQSGYIGSKRAEWCDRNEWRSLLATRWEDCRTCWSDKPWTSCPGKPHMLKKKKEDFSTLKIILTMVLFQQFMLP